MKVLAAALALISGAAAKDLGTQEGACDNIVAADVAITDAGEGVEAEDLNPWRGIAAEFTPNIDRNVADHDQADRIFIRLRAESETGEALARRAASCRD